MANKKRIAASKSLDLITLKRAIEGRQVDVEHFERGRAEAYQKVAERRQGERDVSQKTARERRQSDFQTFEREMEAERQEQLGRFDTATRMSSLKHAQIQQAARAHEEHVLGTNAQWQQNRRRAERARAREAQEREAHYEELQRQRQAESSGALAEMRVRKLEKASMALETLMHGKREKLDAVVREMVERDEHARERREALETARAREISSKKEIAKAIAQRQKALQESRTQAEAHERQAAAERERRQQEQLARVAVRREQLRKDNEERAAQKERERKQKERELQEADAARGHMLLERRRADEERVAAKKMAQAELVETQRELDVYLKGLRWSSLSRPEVVVKRASDVVVTDG